jgi:WD40 repeat protein
MIRKIFQWVGSLLLGGFFLILLLSLISYLKPKEKWGEALSLPTPSPTPSPWENITLDQIRFGEPKVVLTDTLGFRILGWISNEEVLIRRAIKPGGRGSAFEVFNVGTKEVRRLAEGAFPGNPVWNPARRALVYLEYDETRKQSDLIWQSLDTGERKKLASNVVLPIVLVEEGKGALAYDVKEKVLRGRLVTPSAEARRIPFGQYAMRIPTPYGWEYKTAVSPDGKWQVVYNCEHFLLMDTKGGVIKELDLGTERPGGKGLPRWAMDAQWSPDGKKLAIIATRGNLPSTVWFLLLMNPQTGALQEVSLSRPFVVYEVQWSPNGRFLLASGAIDYKEGVAIIEHRLIDLSIGQERKLHLFPSDPTRGSSFAWSPDGKKLILNCTEPGLAALCVLPVEVQR